MTGNVRLNTSVDLVVDFTPNDSDKTIVVADGFEWDIESVLCQIATTAAAGNRIMAVEFLTAESGGEILGLFIAGAGVPPASGADLTFAPGLENQTALVSNTLTTAIPAVRLAEGHAIRVFDLAAIDPTIDNMIVRILVNTRRI